MPTGAPKPPVPIHQHARSFQFALPLHADFRHDEVTAVTHYFFVRQFRKRVANFFLDHRATCY
jgi:hypothetical protein